MLRSHCALWLAAILLPTGVAAQQQASSGVTLPSRIHQCIADAATYHRVNVDVLVAIARVESRGNGRTVARNSNNSSDVGLVGTNSVHFPELRRMGIAPEHLFDECVSLYVGAWMYSKKIYKHGNTWKAIGAYNSETPSCNYRYQALIFNELVSMGVIANTSRLPVPKNC